MEIDLRPDAPRTGAMAPLAPGTTITIGNGSLSAEIAAEAGGRIAQIVCDGVEWLIGHDDVRTAATIAWGSYPMVPWAGRIRRGRFGFDGRSYQLPRNLGEHAIHGLAFAMPWRIDAHGRDHAELSLALPDDERWPFGGSSQQRFELDGNRLRMTLSVTAGARAMPVTIGWHPWFHKPERIEFSPTMMYPRDETGIATRPLIEPTPGPWDDCFINSDPVRLNRAGQSLKLTSDCTHWVVYDEIGYATCIEPQSGPPDGLNLEPRRLAPGASFESWFELEWS